MKKWVDKATQKTPAQALDALARMPSYGETGRVQSPFPKVDRAYYQQGLANEDLNAAIEKATIETVPLKDLRGIQASVSRRRVADFIVDPNHIKMSERDPEHGGKTGLPVVVKKGKDLFLHDGHHRATAAKLLGKQSIQARVIEAPALPGVGPIGNPGSHSGAASGSR